MEWKALESNWKNGTLRNIVKQHAPVFVFHPDELYFPLHVEDYFDLCVLSHVKEVENKVTAKAKTTTTTVVPKQAMETKTYPARVLLDPKFYQNRENWQGWSLSALHDDPSVFRFGKHENLSVHFKNVRSFELLFFF